MRVEDCQSQQDFGAYLKYLREKIGLSQRAAGDKAGVSGAYIALLEKGLRNPPSKKVLRRLGEVYALTEDELREMLWRFSDEVVIEWPDLISQQGYKGNWDSSQIEADRLTWAYQCVRSDPSVTLTREMGSSHIVFSNMAWVVYQYQQKTRRRLLTPREQRGLIEWLERGGYYMTSAPTIENKDSGMGTLANDQSVTETP